MTENWKLYGPAANYYGTIFVECKSEKYFIGLDDWSGENSTEVSKEFALAWTKEFGEKESPIA